MQTRFLSMSSLCEVRGGRRTLGAVLAPAVLHKGSLSPMLLAMHACGRRRASCGASPWSLPLRASSVWRPCPSTSQDWQRTYSWILTKTPQRQADLFFGHC